MHTKVPCQIVQCQLLSFLALMLLAADIRHHISSARSEADTLSCAANGWFCAAGRAHKKGAAKQRPATAKRWLIVAWAYRNIPFMQCASHQEDNIVYHVAVGAVVQESSQRFISLYLQK